MYDTGPGDPDFSYQEKIHICQNLTIPDEITNTIKGQSMQSL